MTTTRTAQSRSFLGMRADATSYSAASAQILAWARAGQSRCIALATVNNVMEAYDSPAFRGVMNAADLVTPDGMPLVWGLRLMGIRSASRVYGPDLAPCILGAAERERIPVGFYGATEAVLERLLSAVRSRYPALAIAYAWAPPFRPLSAEEDRAATARINASGARILLIGLSTPKQECWMAAHRGRVGAVMLGVGAAFDFLAGTKRQAPRWMMRAGLEWLFRLASEPRRLARRYLKHNPRFLLLFLAQLAGLRQFR